MCGDKPRGRPGAGHIGALRAYVIPYGERLEPSASRISVRTGAHLPPHMLDGCAHDQHKKRVRDQLAVCLKEGSYPQAAGESLLLKTLQEYLLRLAGTSQASIGWYAITTPALTEPWRQIGNRGILARLINSVQAICPTNSLGESARLITGEAGFEPRLGTSFKSAEKAITLGIRA